jgi:hypothetical protein
MKNRRIAFFALLIPIIFSGCGKQKTLNLDLIVVDGTSEQPVSCHVILWHTKEVAGQGGTDIYTTLGDTDDEGKFRYKKKLGKIHNPKLIISAGKNYSHCMFPDYSWGKATSMGSKHKETIILRRNYHYLVSIKSVNCFDQSDTAWISISEEYAPVYRKIGCVDETIILGGYSNLSYTSIDQTPVFHIKVKRNGVVTEFDQPVTLQFGSITPVQIDY